MSGAATASVARLSRLDHWMFEEYRVDPRGLGLVRILYALNMLAIELPRHMGFTNLPDSFLAPPPGFGWFLHAYPPAWVIPALNTITVFAAVCLLFGWRTRLASLTIATALIAGQTIAYACGLVNHHVMLVLLPILGALAGWGRCYSMDSRGRSDTAPRPAWPLALLALLVGLGMMTAALPKAGTGWLDPATHACRGHIAFRPFIENMDYPLGSLMLKIQSPLFWEALDWGTVLVEAAFLPAVIRLRWFRVMCLIGIVFHVSVWLSLGIPFGCNVLVFLAFADWPKLIDRAIAQRWLAAWSRLIDRVQPLPLLMFGLLVAAAYLLLENPLFAALNALGLTGRWWANLAFYALASLFVLAFVPWRGFRASSPRPMPEAGVPHR